MTGSTFQPKIVDKKSAFMRTTTCCQKSALEVAKINRAVLKHSPNITSLKFGGKYKKLVGSKLSEVPLLECMEARANQHFLSFQHFGR